MGPLARGETGSPGDLGLGRAAIEVRAHRGLDTRARADRARPKGVGVGLGPRSPDW